MTKIIVNATILAVLASAAFQAYTPLIKEVKRVVQKINQDQNLTLKNIHEIKK